MIERLICLIRGHVPRRLNGLFYVVCDRCDATLNLSRAGRHLTPFVNGSGRGSTWLVERDGRPIAQVCEDPRCPAGRERRVHHNDLELMACGILD